MKRRVEDLAVFGGSRAFEDPQFVGTPNVGIRDRFIARVDDALQRRWLSNRGPYVEEFETRLADLAGVRRCVTMANATLGLEIAARATDLKGEVIVPAFTFVATAHALLWQGIRPVFCDIDEATHNIDPNRVEELIGPATTGILAVHLWGRPAAIDALTEIARRHHIELIFDASHALGCEWRGVPIGNHGAAEVISFHATKLVNTFEGGAVLTNDDALADRMKALANFGFRGYDDVGELGINAKMNEISAAMGLTGLEALDEFIEANRHNQDAYRSALEGVTGVRLLEYDPDMRPNYQYVVCEIGDDAGISRDQLLRVLLGERVIARRYFYPGCHRFEPYRTTDPASVDRLPVTDRVAARVLNLPTGTAVTGPTACAIGELVAFAVARGPEIAERLGPVAPGSIYESIS